MTTPKRWTPGDPLTADRLNQVISESVRPRRDISFGNGSSLVNETLGNQSATNRFQPIKLVVAITDFAIPDTPTDTPPHIDDVPSGLVKEIRLNRRSATHDKDNGEKSFRAYDAVGGLTGRICEIDPYADDQDGYAYGDSSQALTKSACDVFYVLYNLGSKRWEVIEAGGSGGGHTIWFTINDVLCTESDYVEETTLVATAIWYNQSCTNTPPGANDDGTYDIYDLCNYLNGLTPEDLIAGTGRATYQYPLTGECQPRWIIDDLCPQPECD
jgi:hypothetical protein